ncbi:MAG: hypothetical protein M3139_16785, partial [Bacteroidota bacterium]|nr:hypothetical protein [Bacteroidota bacterium]
IQLKAAFLLIVFSVNTLVGFACAVGIDMGFNSKHHHDDEATETTVHIHADGKKHIHQNEATKHHDEADNDHHKSKDGKDDCCNDKVTQFAQLDKALSPSLSFVINPLFVTAFISSFYNIDIFFFSQASPDVKYFVRSYHPPIPDIRIAIQSFQI